jgi:hypothetical protein
MVSRYELWLDLRVDVFEFKVVGLRDLCAGWGRKKKKKSRRIKD